MAVRAEPAAAATGPERQQPPGRPGTACRWLLPAGAVLLRGGAGLYLADLATHLSSMAAMRDLVVYRNGGLIVRHVAPAYDGHRASPLYDWTGQNGVQFTYPPSPRWPSRSPRCCPGRRMRWAMTLVSLAALGLSLWLTFGALGYAARPRIRLGATLGVSALALLTEPVQETLGLGQVNLLLMLLVVADLLTPGRAGRADALVARDRDRPRGRGEADPADLHPVPAAHPPVTGRPPRPPATFVATVALGYAVLPTRFRRPTGGTGCS